MISKVVLFLSPVLVIIVMFERIKNNNVLEFHFNMRVKNSEDIKMLKFLEYMRRFNKSYDKVEFKSRFRSFKKSLKEIKRMNRSPQHATFGLTKFSDWTKKEVARLFSSKNWQDCEIRNRTKCGSSRTRVLRNRGKILPRIDWRKANVVGPVLNQKMCRGCWAFSVGGVMESMAAIQSKGPLTRLSIQKPYFVDIRAMGHIFENDESTHIFTLDCTVGEIISCTYHSKADMTGCNKGRPLVDALMFLCHSQLPITTDEDYPLTLTDDDCLKKPSRGVRLQSFVNACDMYKNETELLLALNEGPVTAQVNADYLLNYSEGIITAHCQTTENELNHAVQLVGYDMSGKHPYYILKNSWGADWGEQGYAKLAVNGNQCGIAFSVGYLKVHKD